MKKKGNVGVMKQSKSASDITQGFLELKDDFRCFQRRLGTRTLSHDSIFLSEQHQSQRDLSQENVHRKIQALQMKLQMQKMHLGPPPLVLPIKQTEDHQDPAEVLALSKNVPHKSHLKSYSQGALPHQISPTLPPFYTCAPSSGVDFNNLPQFVPCLDNSAARHRMSIKPRNQRASTKSKRIPTSEGSRSRSESMIILEWPLTDSKEEDGKAVTKQMTRVHSYSSQIVRSGKGPTAPPIKSPCPDSSIKLQVGAADDYNSHVISQYKGKERSAVSATADAGTQEILKSAEGRVAKHPSSAGPTNHKEIGGHKESLYSSKLKGFEGSSVSVVSSVYPHLISLGTEQSQPKSDKEFNIITTHVKRSPLNKDRVQNTIQEHYLQGQPLKSLSRHRNTSPLDNKFEGRNVHQISSTPLSSEEGCLKESITQQRSLSFSISLDKNHERQRTGSFTGQMEHAGEKREHVFPLIKPSSCFKAQDLHKNAQIRATRKEPSELGATSTLSVSSKLRDPTITVTSGQERGVSPANKTQDMAVETQEGVEEAVEVNKELKMSKVIKKQKEEWSASEVKLHTTSQSEVNVKQYNTEVRSLSTPWLAESITPTSEGQNDSNVGPVREAFTVLRNPPLCNSECFISAKSPVFSSTQPQSAGRDQERGGLIGLPDLQASTQLPGSAINITMSTPVMEKSPLKTKESREVFTELSWMTMAREKTRSLQQLFTNTLNDLAGLQTATQPAASPLTQISSQPSAGPIKLKYHISTPQTTVSTVETQQPIIHASIRATYPQPTTLMSSISLSHPSIDHSGGTDFSSKQIFSPASQVQPTYLSSRVREISTHTATNPGQLTGMYVTSTQFNPQTMHAAEQQLYQMSIHQDHPIQQSLPQSVTKHKTSLSPKLTPHLPAYQSPSPVSQHKPLSSLNLGKVDMPQGKIPSVSQAQYAGSLGTKTLLIEQWHHLKPDACKVGDQKSTPDCQTYQSLDEFLTISSHSKFTELAVSPGLMRVNREVKCQKKALPLPSTSSSSLLQLNSNSTQPSWMDLAKRKSMAWSDKTMD